MGVNSEQIYRTVTTDLCTSQYINDMPKITRLSRAKVHLVLILSTSKPKGRYLEGGTGSGVGAKENGLAKWRVA